MEPMREEDWQEKLSPEEYEVLREKGTEAPFSRKYLNHNEEGIYRCKACGNILFTSKQKADSSESDPGLQGWPSFTDPAVAENIGTRPDDSYGMHRTEIYCKKCDGHLGHLFEEKIKGTARKHYCVNSVCLEFEKEGGTAA
ncbi:MAG TPA: peptide-methionine (R)-S-oxide reductase MsrB [Candidatus Paceibacterota bacterium]|nr:peptide-methionine (R)-S-oxide reductase MsrB [Candidatus Paceibacterota bacterium]